MCRFSIIFRTSVDATIAGEIAEPRGNHKTKIFAEPRDERIVKRVVFVRHGQGYHNKTEDYHKLFASMACVFDGGLQVP